MRSVGQVSYDDKEVTVIQVLDSLGDGRGGLTRAVYERLDLLATGKQAILVTVAYQPDIRQIFDHLVGSGAIPEHVQLLNYFEDQRTESNTGSIPVSRCYLDWENHRAIFAAPEKVQSGSLTRYFQEGVFLGIISRGGNGRIRMAEKHLAEQPWIREYRDFFWSDGSLARRDYFDKESRPRYRIYVDTRERPYLASWINENGYEFRTTEFFEQDAQMLGDMRGANVAWLRRKLDHIGPATIYTDEPRTTFALEIGGPDVRHVTSIHTTHYANNRNGADGTKYWVRHYTANLERIDRLVFFTQGQLLDFVSDTKRAESVATYIPHAAPLIAGTAVMNRRAERDPKKIVIVSRLAPDKRVGDAIAAFALALEKEPKAELHIYGQGPASADLKNMVTRRGLGQNVYFHGYTTEVLEAFAGAAGSVVTSKYEGFGLVITESFSVGTPVIAYDVPYGPRELVKDSENGFLCPDGDIESIARAMVSLLSRTDLEISRMEASSRESAEMFSTDLWAEGWRSTLVNGV